MALPCSFQGHIFEPQSPRQAKADVKMGKMLLKQDKFALLWATKEGDETKVGRRPAPRLSIPATFDRRFARADDRTLILPRPGPLSALCDHGPQYSRLGRCGS